jgi:hypothetical protein
MMVGCNACVFEGQEDSRPPVVLVLSPCLARGDQNTEVTFRGSAPKLLEPQKRLSKCGIHATSTHVTGEHLHHPPSRHSGLTPWTPASLTRSESIFLLGRSSVFFASPRFAMSIHARSQLFLIRPAAARGIARNLPVASARRVHALALQPTRSLVSSSTQRPAQIVTIGALLSASVAMLSRGTVS